MRIFPVGRRGGDAEVVLALTSGDPLESPRLYNFLPMGEQVGCPLPAYLQAPFFSSLDRRSLNEAYPINEMFLNEAALLATDLLLAATEGGSTFRTGHWSISPAGQGTTCRDCGLPRPSDSDRSRGCRCCLHWSRGAASR
ncbi:hypothetical protein [Nocardioides ungokensis]|uniref:hypothetical protein n=1 Tax=Nocardioides ungokensis TaxID=1643322 RepID=UPI0015DF588B|nr:hypothetical protein [Nocardioides ungokensis]